MDNSSNPHIFWFLRLAKSEEHSPAGFDRYTPPPLSKTAPQNPNGSETANGFHAATTHKINILARLSDLDNSTCPAGDTLPAIHNVIKRYCPQATRQNLSILSLGSACVGSNLMLNAPIGSECGARCKIEKKGSRTWNFPARELNRQKKGGSNGCFLLRSLAEMASRLAEWAAG
jgi:hypothetical protein